MDRIKDDTSRLGLGTAPFAAGYGLPAGDQAPEPDAAALVRAAVAAGITYCDTAESYGNVEAALGACADVLIAQRVRLCTKLRADAGREGLLGSLRRLGGARLDTLLLHSASVAELQDPAVAAWLVDAQREGLVSCLGASTYGIAAAAQACEQPWCRVVQVEHSLLNPSVVRAIAARKRAGQQLVVRSVLCQGLLTDRRRHAGRFGQTAHARLDELEGVAREWGFTLPELAIRFALDTPGVDIALVGMCGVAELRTALDAARRAPLQSWQTRRLEQFDCSAEAWSHPERWPVAA